jgi:hypothetical protein
LIPSLEPVLVPSSTATRDKSRIVGWAKARCAVPTIHRDLARKSVGTLALCPPYEDELLTHSPD